MVNKPSEHPKDKEKEKTEQERMAEEFLKTVESLIRKSQKESWLNPDHDHPYDKTSTQ